MDRRILVADDDAGTRELLSVILKDLNCDFDVAENGAEARKLIVINKYDLIFLDIRMPKIEGTELITYLKKYWPEVILVVISGYLDSEKKTLFESWGVKEIIEKPFSVENIENVIRKYSA